MRGRVRTPVCQDSAELVRRRLQKRTHAMNGASGHAFGGEEVGGERRDALA